VTVDARFEDMSRRYASGETTDSISKSYNITRERVRQIISWNGGPTAKDARSARHADKNAAEQALRVRLNSLIDANPGISGKELAQLAQVASKEVYKVLTHEEKRKLYHTIEGTKSYSDEQILEALQRVHKLVDVPLTRPIYDSARMPGAEPTAQAVAIRFERWTAACSAAGVPCQQPNKRSYLRRWTQDEIVTWVAKYLSQSSERSASGYANFARQNLNCPSLGTVKKVFGTWSAVRTAALHQLTPDTRPTA
jgi:hypothetical protein